MKLLALLVMLSNVYAGPMAINTLKDTAVHVLKGGSGSIVKSPFTGTKYILTNWHVCNQANKGELLLSITERGERLVGPVVHKSAIFDLCLIEVIQDKLALELAESLELGEHLNSHGWPRHKFRETCGRYTEDITVDLDITDSLNDSQCPQGFKTIPDNLHLSKKCFGSYPSGRTTLFADRGSSGSAVVDDNARLVGVIQSADLGDRGGYSGFMIKLDRIREFFKGY